MTTTPAQAATGLPVATTSWPALWSRGAVAVAGTLALGILADVSTILALAVIAVWLHYTATTPAQRSAGLLALGLGLGWLARTLLGI